MVSLAGEENLRFQNANGDVEGDLETAVADEDGGEVGLWRMSGGVWASPGVDGKGLLSRIEAGFGGGAGGGAPSDAGAWRRAAASSRSRCSNALAWATAISLLMSLSTSLRISGSRDASKSSWSCVSRTWLGSTSSLLGAAPSAGGTIGLGLARVGGGRGVVWGDAISTAEPV